MKHIFIPLLIASFLVVVVRADPDSNLDPSSPQSEYLAPQSTKSEQKLDITISSFEDHCDVQCPIGSDNKFTCYIDGNIYPNDCAAICHSAGNYADFVCGDRDLQTCAELCQQAMQVRRCKEPCEKAGANFSAFCFEGSVVQVNECRAKCEGSSGVTVFSCTKIGYPTGMCQSKCADYISAKENGKCSDQRQDFLCGRDGLVYAGECRAQLVGITTVGPAEGDSLEDQNKCADFALKNAVTGTVLRLPAYSLKRLK